MTYFNFNGKLLAEHTPIIGADNRGLRYGDGLFETILFKNESFVLLDEHLARLWNGMKLLQFELPRLFTPDLLEAEMHHLVKKNKHPHARIRLTILRGDGGLYDAQNHAPQYIIQSWSLPQSSGSINENGLQLCIYKDALKSIDAFSNCKHNNYLPYLMGALHAKNEKCNDALILNQQNRICDATIANIFIVAHNQIITPPLSEGCVAGIMRQEIIASLKNTDMSVTEKNISEEDLLAADEVFLTNSIYQIRWVAGIGNKNYTCAVTTELYRKLIQTNPVVFC